MCICAKLIRARMNFYYSEQFVKIYAFKALQRPELDVLVSSGSIRGWSRGPVNGPVKEDTSAEYHTHTHLHSVSAKLFNVSLPSHSGLLTFHCSLFTIADSLRRDKNFGTSDFFRFHHECVRTSACRKTSAFQEKRSFLAVQFLLYSPVNMPCVLMLV